jgi:hypothetical protein
MSSTTFVLAYEDTIRISFSKLLKNIVTFITQFCVLFLIDKSQYLFILPTLFGGGKRVRTDDPLLAKQVLYQLSYTPDYLRNTSLFSRLCANAHGASSRLVLLDTLAAFIYPSKLSL